MMEQLTAFVIHHPWLCGTFAVFLGLLLFTETRRGGRRIGTGELVRLVNTQSAQVIDLRSPADFSRGTIANAVNIPFSGVSSRLGELEKHKGLPVVLVDAMGQHAGAVSRQLQSAGFDSVTCLSGGIASWTSENLPLVKLKT